VITYHKVSIVCFVSIYNNTCQIGSGWSGEQINSLTERSDS